VKLKKNDELSRIEALKFLMERSHFEAQLLWQRNNFMFITSTALLGASFYYFFINVPERPPSNEIKTVASVSGIFVALIWFAFNKVGRRMNQVYVQDAKNLCNEDEVLSQIFKNSLGEKTPSESVEKKGNPLISKIKRFWSATMINYIFISGFITAWLYVLIRPIGS
jgi:hypothetical protein